jgi:hypothetical protein
MIPTFIYFLEQYRDQLQMVDTDLIKIFCNVESDEQKKKLQNEVKLIELNLGLEDWDMEKSIANLCSKYSKRRIKRIVHFMHKELNI